MSRAHRFYLPVPLAPGAEVLLPAPLAHRLGHVLRSRPGDALILFPGDGSEYAATLVRLGPAAAARVGAVSHPDTESACRLTLGVANLKGEKPEWVVQKLTELGAAGIRLVDTSRGIVTADEARWARRRERYRRIAEEAAEQCGRVRVPCIEGPAALAEVLASCEAPAFILDPRAGPSLASRVNAGLAAALVLIGPEGGFTEAEQRLAIGAGAEACNLGPRVLRAETAALAAAALFAAAEPRREESLK